MLDLDNNFTMSHLLGSFLGNPYDLQEFQALSSNKVCPNCGMTFANIRQMGKLGCSQCYTAFEKELEPTLRRISGTSGHVGKIPARSGKDIMLKKNLEELKNQLQQAVSQEKYEKAVEIRDAIKELEKDLA